MKLVKLSDIFDISYGTKFDMNKMEIQDNSDIPFVSRTSKNNGIAGFVEKFDDIEPLEKGQITVSLGGTYVLSAFLQEVDFYTGQNVAVLKPTINLTKEEKLYYCIAITKNRFRYGAFGREANRTIKELKVPDPSEIPSYIYDTTFKSYKSIERKINDVEINLNPKGWKEFRYDEIFDIKKGFYNKKPPITESGDGIPFIGATESNNGITGMIDYEDIVNYSKIGKLDSSEPIEKKLFDGNCITVTNNGSVGFAFYQPVQFTCSHDVNPLYLKNYTMNRYIAMFLITLIQLEKYRWGYGRKWRPIRMPNSIIRLPIKKDNEPDWQYMENYIKSLNFSVAI